MSSPIIKINHEYSKCKISPPNPHNCNWMLQSEYYDNGLERGKHWEKCTDNEWCDECIIGYHKVCENIEKELSKHLKIIVDLDDISKFKLIDKIKEDLINAKEYTKLNKLENNIIATISGFKRCQRYRDNVYKHCFRNTKTPKIKTDKRHENHNNIITKFNKELNVINKKVRSAKRKTKKTKSASKTIIRSYI